MLFGKSFLIGAVIEIVIIIFLSHRVSKPTFLTLLSQVLTHIIKVSLVTAECLPCDGMAIAYEKMCVRVGLVDMGCEQHFVALKKLLSKVFRYPEYFFVSQLVPVIRRERYRDLIREVCIAGITLTEQLSRHHNISRKIITITVNAPIQVRGCFYNSVLDLLR